MTGSISPDETFIQDDSMSVVVEDLENPSHRRPEESDAESIEMIFELATTTERMEDNDDEDLGASAPTNAVIVGNMDPMVNHDADCGEIVNGLASAPFTVDDLVAELSAMLAQESS